MSEDIELLKKKIVYKSFYRGIKELDIILRSFVNKHLNKLNLEELNDLIEFLENNDEDIYKFKQGIKVKKKIKNNSITNLFRNFEI